MTGPDGEGGGADVQRRLESVDDGLRIRVRTEVTKVGGEHGAEDRDEQEAPTPIVAATSSPSAISTRPTGPTERTPTRRDRRYSPTQPHGTLPGKWAP
jgi:hypothetical protein